MPRRRRCFVGALCLATVALAGAACVPEPRPGSVDVAGDSLTIQAFYNGGFGEGAPSDLDVIADNGWTVGNAQRRVDANILAGRPSVLVVAFATNDAHPWHGGWTSSDVAAFRRMMSAPHPSACVVLVLPGWGAGASIEHGYHMHQARSALSRLARERPRTVVVDWLPVLQAHPEYLRPDGIHLSGLAAWHARSALYWQGVAGCPAA